VREIRTLRSMSGDGKRGVCQSAPSHRAHPRLYQQIRDGHWRFMGNGRLRRCALCQNRNVFDIRLGQIAPPRMWVGARTRGKTTAKRAPTR
jgi:hypothetical protein